jgi:predicted O-methyltransferase YrrM
MFENLRSRIFGGAAASETTAVGDAGSTVGQRQAAVARFDVTPFQAELDLDQLRVLTSAPVWMTRAERLTLFTLTFCLRPARYMEIGTLKGGSALIVASAMAALGSDGRIFCVDPEPRVAPEDWARLESRAQMFRGFSPQILPEVASAAGGPFDLVLIDGDHSYQGAIRDAKGVLPFMSHGGYILFHDAFFADVRKAIDEFVLSHRAAVTDLGVMTREITTTADPLGQPVEWGGLRLVYVH